MNFYFRIERKLYKLFHPPLGEVLMLHRVVEERSVLEANRQMEVTPEFLEKTIVGYLQEGREIVSLDEVYDILTRRKKVKKPFVCFTFDDGYIDNYELAYPIFKKYNVPFAIYVATDFPDGRAVLWWYVLEDILMKNNELLLDDGSVYDCSDIEKKNQIFNLVRDRIFEIQSNDMFSTIQKLFGQYSFSFQEIGKKYSLNWTQIIDLANDPLCTIGSHTVSHAALDHLTEEQVEEELINSKKTLEKYLNKSIIHFAYPYGKRNRSIVNLVTATGYTTAVLANGGVERKDALSFELRRVSLLEKVTNYPKE
jgi:peptidoglycan/xylan/chitin deacetylase (PgdA/CDA1 family)